MSAQPDSLEQSRPDRTGPASISQRFKRRERWWAALFFAFVVVFAFPQVVFFGKSLVPTDNYNPLEYTFDETNYGPGFVPAEEWGSRGLILYPNFHDPGGDWWQGEPALKFFRKSIFSGQFPFWDPSAAAGAPAYANLQCQFLFPPQIVLSLLGSSSTEKNIYILFLFWAAGYTTYCLLRLHDLGPLASAAGGLVFLFSGAMQQMGPSLFLGQVVACMPLLFIITRWFINQPTWRRTAGLAAVYAAVSLASFPPILCAAFGSTVFYFLFALSLEKHSSRVRLLIQFGVAACLSLGIVAVYYLPAFITIAHTPYVTQWYQTAATDFLAARSIFDLFSPTANGGALVYASPILSEDIGHLYYVGAAGLLLVGLAFGRAKGKSRTLLVACSVVAALTLLKIFGLRPVQWIASLPGSQSVHYYLYFGILVAFLFSLLAALGLERLLLVRPWIQYLISICVVGAGARALWVFAREKGALVPYQAWRWIADYHLLVLFAGIVAVLTGIVLLRNAWSKAAKTAAYLLLLLIFVEGVVNATYPRQRRWGIFEHPPKYMSELQRLPRPARLFVAATLTANLGSAFGLETLDSLYMFSPPRIYDVYERYANPAAAITMREATVLPPDQVLDRAGITHVLVRENLPVVFPEAVIRQYPSVYNDDYVRLFRREGVRRYSFSSEYQVVAEPKAALKAISTVASGTVILESPPGFPATANREDDPAPQVISSKLNSLELRVRAPRPGILYIADAYYPGWKATVNGQPSEILPANYAFRAIRIPAGDVRVALRYLPVGLIPGVIISIICIGGAIFLASRPSPPKAFVVTRV